MCLLGSLICAYSWTQAPFILYISNSLGTWNLLFLVYGKKKRKGGKDIIYNIQNIFETFVYLGLLNRFCHGINYISDKYSLFWKRRSRISVVSFNYGSSVLFILYRMGQIQPTTAAQNLFQRCWSHTKILPVRQMQLVASLEKKKIFSMEETFFLKMVSILSLILFGLVTVCLN